MATFSNTMVLILFLCFTILRCAYSADTGVDDGKVESNIKKLKDKLFKNYDKNVSSNSPENPTKVLFELQPRCIIDLDEERSLLTVDSFFMIDLPDKRLRWDPAEYDGLKILQVPTNSIWLPDFRVLNGKNTYVDFTKNTRIWINPRGTVIWDNPETVTVFCDVKTPIGSYPDDTHECNVTVGSQIGSGWQIEIFPYIGGRRWKRFSNTNPRWEVDIEKSNFVKGVKKFDCCKESYITIDSIFSLRRRPPAHLRVVRTPCIIVMMLTLAMFWIPSNSRKKISIGVFLMIILTILTIYCATVTKSPLAPQVAVSFIQSTTIAVASAVLLEVLVIKIARNSGPRKAPQLLRGLLSGPVGNYICLWTPQLIAGGKFPPGEDAETKQEWLIVATGFDRLLFIVNIIIFAAIHQI